MNIKDSRFAKISRDPRFKHSSSTNTKLRIDDRFADVIKEGSAFDREEGTQAKVDKYGRKVGKQSIAKDMQRFYHLDQEIEEKNGGEVESENEVSEEHDKPVFSEEEEKLVPAIQEGFGESVPVGDATKRMAILNLDWDQIKCSDLMVLLMGFKPTCGTIHSVSLYKSEFGKERLAREAFEGPPRELFSDTKDSSKDSKEALEESESEKEEDEEEDPLVKEEDDTDYNAEQLRQYQLQRMRYYYAVVECDSPETAASLYAECDGKEFETSANILDLRYIPDEIAFDEVDFVERVRGDDPHKLTLHYKAKPDLVTPALQSSRVKLTWDEDDAERRRLFLHASDTTNLKRRKQAHDDDREDPDEEALKAYLASATSSDGSDDEQSCSTAKKLKSLLLQGEEPENVFGRKTNREGKAPNLVFPVGFEEDGIADSGVDQEATFYASDDDDDDGFVLKPKNNNHGNKEVKEEESASPSHFDKIVQLRAQKLATKKAEKAERAAKAAKEQAAALKEAAKAAKEARTQRKLARKQALKDQKKHEQLLRKQAKKNDKPFSSPFAASGDVPSVLEDKRFERAVLGDDADFNINPTDPQFKDTPVMHALLQERQRKRSSTTTASYRIYN